jgi:hypothetical protein
MTRVRTLLARAIVLALLLLTIGGGIANADTLSGDLGTQVVPEDPGYELSQ